VEKDDDDEVRGRQQRAAGRREDLSRKKEKEKCGRSASEERGEARGRDGPIKVGRLRAQERW
jgi:hypothetical protein